MNGSSPACGQLLQACFAALRAHPNSRVVYPIPAKRHKRDPTNAANNSSRFKIVYAGNLGDYGELLAGAMKQLKDHPEIQFEVRGSSPRWSIPFQTEMRECGMRLPFAQRDEFESWLDSADVFLILKSISIDDRRKLETNFPSKIPEMAQHGKPIILWGPRYGSANKWNETIRSAISVTDSDPLTLATVLSHLAGSSRLQQDLCTKIAKFAKEEFNPETIQKQFVTQIRTLFQATHE